MAPAAALDEDALRALDLLVVNEGEAATVRMIFERFVALGSASTLARALQTERPKRAEVETRAELGVRGQVGPRFPCPPRFKIRSTVRADAWAGARPDAG